MTKLLKKCGAVLIGFITVAICLWILFGSFFMMSKIVNYYSVEKIECNN
jgi:hypothetical protein